MKRIYLYIIIGIVVLGTAGYFLLFNSNSDDVKYRTEKVTRGSVVQQVRATGTINPVQTVQVGSQVSGTIEKIYVDFNSEVQRGQVIARIDSTFLYASVQEAQANLERNQAQVNEAERTLARTSELFKKNLVSQADLDAAQTGYEAASAQLKQAQGALDRARINLRYAVIRAPIDGVVISRDVEVGQTVASSFQTPKLFSIANDLKRMQIEASVDEADIGQIKQEQEATFTVDAYPEEQFAGSVSQIRLAPVTVQNVVTYTVIIAVPNPNLKLRPGMTATVSILIEKRDDVLRIPTLAMRFQPPAEVVEKFKTDQTSDTSKPDASRRRFMRRDQEQGGGTEQMQFRRRESGESQRGERPFFSRREFKTARVWVMEHGKNLMPVTVRTGINDNRYVEVIGDKLKEGDDVVIGMVSSEVASSTQQNPFGPQRMIMGGPGGRGMR